MRKDTVREWIARGLLTLAALLPYAPLLTFSSIYVTDDYFTSDIYNGELPGLVLLGKILARGQLPIWTSQLCTGFPLSFGEPLQLLTFATLPIAAALDVYVIVLLMVAAHGTYGFARRVGASRLGAVLAGVAFAASGYIVTQLKHLAIVNTVVWLPWGLLLLDKAFTPTRPGVDGSVSVPPRLSRRLVSLALFGLVFAEQSLTGFPQSTYICGLVYAAYACFGAVRAGGRVGKRLPLGLVLLAAFGAASALGALTAAIRMLPLAELGSVSDRSFSPGWQFASMAPYSPRDAIMFVAPYARGDASDNTYEGPGLFWENYGYVGVATFLLALYALAREWRRRRLLALAAIMAGAYLLVLGPSTPVFHLAWKYFPGMALFRFPTRFLVVVDLMLAVLGGVGLTRLLQDMSRWLRGVSPRVPVAIGLAICVGTVFDLFLHQPRQNPFVNADRWLGPPPSVSALAPAADGSVRVYAPLHMLFHMAQATGPANGWTNLGPYWELRDTLGPNISVYWDVASGDCYTGIAPKWHADVWGTSGGPGVLVQWLARARQKTAITTVPEIAQVLGTYGITHVLTPVPLEAKGLVPLGEHGKAHVYAVDGRRARVVRTARPVTSTRDAVALLREKGFDADETVVLHDAPPELPTSAEPKGPRPAKSSEAAAVSARVTEETSTRVRVELNDQGGGYLLLADTYYPGWVATVDGQPAPIYRANISSRAVPLPPGARVVELHYRPRSFHLGWKLSLAGLCALLAALSATCCIARRRERDAANAAV